MVGFRGILELGLVIESEHEDLISKLTTHEVSPINEDDS